MQLGLRELQALLTELADRDTPRSEADVQSNIKTLLLLGGLNLDDPRVRLETPAPGRRRVDIETGFTVIECKKDLRIGNIRAEAMEQLAGYVRARTASLGQRYAGVLTDGSEWRLYHLSSANDELHEVSAFSLRRDRPDIDGLLVWLEGVLSTAEQIEPTQREVKRRLGADGPGAKLDLAELSDIYAECKVHPEVQIKRELWARLLAGAFGSSFEDEDQLFIEHTYLVLTAEAIAHAIMGFDIRGGSVSALDLVQGKRFREARISGVVEADFFDWPSHSACGLRFIGSLARRVGRFDWSRVEHDVLKVLYESVIDQQTRHRLGEYYTPDWLAEAIVVDVVDDPLNQRVLEPACGSGTFLFSAVRRYLHAADAAGLPNREAVNGALAHVCGIDLHPVAVTLARVTYLMAIGTDRLRDRDPLAIPVYLGDSIQFNQSTSVLSRGAITVQTTREGRPQLELELEQTVRALSFPESVVADASRFDHLVDEMATRAARRNKNGQPPSIERVMTLHGVTVESDRDMLMETYRVLCELHDARRDHIWGYYVRNLTRPIEFTRPEGRVDRLVGNPPWLRYNAMTADMQAGFRRLTRERQLQAPAQVVTSQDLAGLFAVRCIEQYLRVGGRFGFVMPAAALSRLQYRRFRAGDFTSAASVAAVSFGKPWELSLLRPQPFPVPASVVFGSRVDANRVRPMPDAASWWDGAVDHRKSWQQLKDIFVRHDETVVVASTEYAAPYASVAHQGANLVPRVLVGVQRRDPGHLGVATDEIAVQSDRSSPERDPWKSLDTLTGAVEARFVRRMLLGESLLPFCLRGERLAIVPATDSGRLITLDSDDIDDYPGLQDWWTRADELYRSNAPATTKHDLAGQVDYQGKLTSQLPLRAHRVAYTGRGERVTAARISDDAAVVDHALYWASFASEDEALYATTVINSAALHSRIVSALSKGLFGGRNIHRAPFLVPWPRYDPTDGKHGAIVRSGRVAEDIARAVTSNGPTASARNQVRAALVTNGVDQRIENLVGGLLARATSEEQAKVNREQQPAWLSASSRAPDAIHHA